jgi:hypothetical protein
MKIARNVQSAFDEYSPYCWVVHMNSNDDGMAQITSVKKFIDCDDAANYYYNNGNSVSPSFVMKPKPEALGILLNGEKYSCAIEVYKAQINFDPHIPLRESYIKIRRAVTEHMSEQDQRSGFLDIAGELSASTRKVS